MNQKTQNDQKQPRRIIVPNKDLGIDWHKKGVKDAPNKANQWTLNAWSLVFLSFKYVLALVKAPLFAKLAVKSPTYRRI